MSEPIRVDITDIAPFVDGFKSARANEQDWKNAKDTFQKLLENRLKAAGATIGTVDGKDTIKLTTFDTSKTDYKKLKAEYPELVDQYTILTEGHRFSTP